MNLSRQKVKMVENVKKVNKLENLIEYEYLGFSYLHFISLYILLFLQI